MPLVLCQQVETTVPIEVGGITPVLLAGQSGKQISSLSIKHGRTDVELGELFKISGSIDDSQTIVFDGFLQAVHSIGAAMKGGRIEIKTNAGRRVGVEMTGGEIVANANVSDYPGFEMTGGTIRVAGDAGDSVGGHFPGSKFGMNRGSIFINGSVGKGLGQAMRRGTIVVGGDADELAGWNMYGGTIIVFGNCERHVGAGMKRGTIVTTGKQPELLPTFAKGSLATVPVLGMMAKWLEEQSFPCKSIEKLRSTFQAFDGDLLEGGRGELFVAC